MSAGRRAVSTRREDGHYLAQAAREPWAWANLITSPGRPGYSDIRAINGWIAL